MERTMLTQTEIRPAAGDVHTNWQLEVPVRNVMAPVTPEQFRDALSRIAPSVSIVATDGAHGIAAFTCSAVCSVPDEPPTIMACVNPKSPPNPVTKPIDALCASSS